MSQAQLDELFYAHEAGPIPEGEAEGTAIISPGTTFDTALYEYINTFSWKGTKFDSRAGFLRNNIRADINAIIARIYKAPSWLDAKECIVLDYSETSLVASHVRDEMRLVAPGLYLGKVYWDKTRLVDFSLNFRKTRAGGS